MKCELIISWKLNQIYVKICPFRLAGTQPPPPFLFLKFCKCIFLFVLFVRKLTNDLAKRIASKAIGLA